MITEDLVAYLRAQLRKNIPKYITVFRLTQAGWHPEDIEEGYSRVAALASMPEQAPTPVVAAPVIAQENPTPVVAPEPKIWIPTVAQPIVAAAPVEPIAQPVQPQRSAESMVQHVAYIPPTETATEIFPEGLQTAFGQSPTPLQPAPVQPVQAPVAPVPVVVAPVIPQSAPIIAPIVATPVPVVAAPAPAPIATPAVAPTVYVVKEKPVAPVAPVTPVAQPAPLRMSSPAPVASSITERKQALASSVDAILRPGSQIVPTVSSAESLRAAQERSQKAMLTSYTQDSLSASEEQHHPHVSGASHTMKMPMMTKKKIFIIIGVLVLLGLAIVVFATGIIPFPAFSFVKKDPQDAILNSSSGFSGLKSYKSDISASITIPSFATITSGLVTGNSVNSVDLESLSLEAKGQISQGIIAPTSSLFEGTITSSLLKDPITSSWNYDGTTSYINVPDLSELFGNNAPPPATVAIGPGQFALLLPELPQNIQDTIKKADIYNIISNGVPPYAQTQVAKVFEDFIGNLTATDKGEEIIDGVTTYHYTLAASQSVTKKFLSDLLSVFVISLSGDMKANVDAALGSVSLDSFDIWVGKDDNLVHQYQFTFTAPLSKVIALDDKGISGKTVSFNFKDTFYDFNVPNTVQIPMQSTPMTDFIQSIRDTKIKSIIDSFDASARNLMNAEGGYGKQANASGSCSGPTPGSLFSPIGHTGGASAQVGVIASTMNDLLAATNGGGFCYSSTSHWALSAPLASDHNTYYCDDSAGNSGTLSTVPSGTACK